MDGRQPHLPHVPARRSSNARKEEGMPEQAPLMVITEGDDGSMQVIINETSPIVLWGIAKLIEKRADEVNLQQSMLARSRKPTLVVPK